MIQHDATDKLTVWVETHGTQENPQQIDAIGAPIDFMLAMIASADEVSNDEELSEEERTAAAAAWKALLTWISDTDGHELEDDGGRGRLIAFMRFLDVDQTLIRDRTPYIHMSR